MAKYARQKFQMFDIELSRRLKEVFASEDDRLLIGIADNYGSLHQFNEDSADKIRAYMTEEVRSEHMHYINKKRVYYNAYVTRPYVLMADNITDAPKKRFELWKAVWESRDVVIVEGAQSRIGVGNDLLENARSIRRIVAPATNSFSQYDNLLKSSIENAHEGDVFLIALGPSAGVLAYDLTQAGYQALDIGHLDLEYEWFLAGKYQRVPILHKYNNEFPGDEEAQPIYDLDYEKQIIVKCE